MKAPVTLPSPLAFFQKVITLLYPPRCICCGRILPGESPLCLECAESWQNELGQAASPRDDGVYFLAPYTKGRSVTRKLVLNAKQSNERRLYIFLSLELSKLLEHYGMTADLIVNVPRSPVSVRNTGVDQSGMLARALSKSLGIRYLNVLRHRHISKAQKTLNAARRRQNAKSAYKLVRKAPKHLAGRSIVLVDDVATTGATFSACENLLLGAGAAQVYKIAVASTELT